MKVTSLQLKDDLQQQLDTEVEKFFVNHYKHLFTLYRVSFFTGPAQKSSKYGTGPAQQRKTTKFTEDGKNPY